MREGSCVPLAPLVWALAGAPTAIRPSNAHPAMNIATRGRGMPPKGSATRRIPTISPIRCAADGHHRRRILTVPGFRICPLLHIRVCWQVPPERRKALVDGWGSNHRRPARRQPRDRGRHVAEGRTGTVHRRRRRLRLARVAARPSPINSRSAPGPFELSPRGTWQAQPEAEELSPTPVLPPVAGAAPPFPPAPLVPPIPRSPAAPPLPLPGAPPVTPVCPPPPSPATPPFPWVPAAAPRPPAPPAIPPLPRAPPVAPVTPPTPPRAPKE